MVGSHIAGSDPYREAADVDECRIKALTRLFKQTLLARTAQAASYARQLKASDDQMIHGVTEQLRYLALRVA